MNKTSGFGRSAGRFRRDERGGPLAEFALMIPFLLLLTFGSFEFGRVLYMQHIITKGVQDAARYAARHSASIDPSSCVPSTAAWSAVVTNAQNIAAKGSISATSVIIADFTPSTVTVSVTCVSPSGTEITSNPIAGTNIPIVVVSAVVPVTDIGFLHFIGDGSLTLRAEHREMAIGL